MNQQELDCLVSCPEDLDVGESMECIHGVTYTRTPISIRANYGTIDFGQERWEGIKICYCSYNNAFVTLDKPNLVFCLCGQWPTDDLSHFEICNNCHEGSLRCNR